MFLVLGRCTSYFQEILPKIYFSGFWQIITLANCQCNISRENVPANYSKEYRVLQKSIYLMVFATWLNCARNLLTWSVNPHGKGYHDIRKGYTRTNQWSPPMRMPQWPMSMRLPSDADSRAGPAAVHFDTYSSCQTTVLKQNKIQSDCLQMYLDILHS